MGKQESQVYSEAGGELYTASGCHYCKNAREFFNRRGSSFSEYDIEVNAGAAVCKLEIDGRPGAPSALVNGQAMHGFLPTDECGSPLICKQLILHCALSMTRLLR